MRPGSSRSWLVGAGFAAAAAVGVAAGSSSVRASFLAAARAFADPSLVERGAATAPAQRLEPAPTRCDPSVGADGLPAVATLLRTDFDVLGAAGDDPDAASLASLTMPDLPVPITRRTLRFVQHFAKSEAGRRSFLERLRRSGRVRPLVEQALREAGLPEDLLWVAAVESGFDPTATSPAGASGLWQFMPETGTAYGLEQSPFVDERRHLARSTQAAVTHLRDLYERFHRWDLALAAYNAGFDRVLGAMEKAAKARDELEAARLARREPAGPQGPIDFAELAAIDALPKETQSYVPQVMAFALVASNLARFGLDGGDLRAAPPLEQAELVVPAGTKLRVVARAAGISLATLREHNPQLLRDRTPPTGGDSIVMLPADRLQRAATTFQAYLEADTVARVEEDDPLAPPIVQEGDAEVDSVRLPTRPRHLGKNRLPVFGVPGGAPSLPGGSGLALALEREPRLTSLDLTKGVGWHSSLASADPFGLMQSARAEMARYSHAALERDLGFLHGASPEAALPSTTSATLDSGVELRVVRSSSHPDVQITVRVATGHPTDSLWLRGQAGRARASEPGGLRFGAGESVHTLSVSKADLELGLALAAGRARALLSQGSAAALGVLRAQLAAPRRRALLECEGGAVTVALWEALFPASHPLHGSLPGRTDDATAARDEAALELLASDLDPRRVTIVVDGDVSDEVVRPLLDSNLSALLGRDLFGPRGQVGPHPADDRVSVESSEARLVLGFVVPEASPRERAALELALEVLVGTHGGRLQRALVRGADCPTESPCEKAATEARAAVERGSSWVVALEVVPSASSEASAADAAALLAKVDRVIASLASDGPSSKELGLARFWVERHLAKALGPTQAAGKEKPADTRSFAIRLGELVRGSSVTEAMRDALPKLQAGDVQKAVKKYLSPEHRVVVTAGRKVDPSPVVVAAREPR
jgi:membrane-bound lytic murein transglycosylase D